MSKFVLAVLFLAFSTAARLAQGTVHFANRVCPNDRTTVVCPGSELLLDAPVFETGGVVRIAGSRFLAQLYAGPDDSMGASVQPVGAPVPFLTGSFAGYWQPVVREIPGLPPGSQAVIQVRAWDSLAGATYEEAAAKNAAASSAFLSGFQLGDASAPPIMEGLTSFHIPPIPEPNVARLAAFAAGVFFVRFLRGAQARRARNELC